MDYWMHDFTQHLHCWVEGMNELGANITHETVFEELKTQVIHVFENSHPRPPCKILAVVGEFSLGPPREIGQIGPSQLGLGWGLGCQLVPGYQDPSGWHFSERLLGLSDFLICNLAEVAARTVVGPTMNVAIKRGEVANQERSAQVLCTFSDRFLQRRQHACALSSGSLWPWRVE